MLSTPSLQPQGWPPSQMGAQPQSLSTVPPIAKSPQALAFQKLLEESVNMGKADQEERSAVEEDQNLRQLVADALQEHSGDEEPADHAPESALAGERVNGFYSPLAELD